MRVAGAGAAFGLAVIGYFIAPRVPLHECTDSDCNNRLGATEAVCPGCKHPVARMIEKLIERLGE